MHNKTLQYKSVNDLRDTIVANQGVLPKQIDLVVGIPRSGMIPAYLIGLSLNLPVTDLPAYMAGKSIEGGFRIGKVSIDLEKPLNVLIVDDSISSGKQILKTKAELLEKNTGHNHIFLAVFAAPAVKHHADISLEIVELPRVFEWNILHSWIYEYSCVDIDGVLCEDPTEEQNDDGEKYRHFLLNAPPKFLPPSPVMSLVTSRLEKYRPETEAWLKKHGVEYNELIMLDLPDKATRVKHGSHGAHKAMAYKANDKALLFIESAKHQAIEIFSLTGRPVFSIEGFHFWPHHQAPKVELKKAMPITKKQPPFLSRVRRKIAKVIRPKK